MIKPKTPRTFQAGVNSARSSFIAKLRYDAKYAETNAVKHALEKLVDWVLAQNERDDAKQGGRGRKAK